MNRVTLPEKTEQLQPYDPELWAARVHADANESYLSLPESLRVRIAEEIANFPFERYPDPLATELCAAFADLYGVPRQCVVAGNGSDELISILMNCLLQKGDKVLTFSPDFSMYRFYAGLAEAECVTLPCGVGESPDFEQAAAYIAQEDIRLVIFSNPCNPTGLGTDGETLRRFIRKTGAIVVLDEAYMDFWNQSLLREVEQYPNLLILRTCSKAIGLAALRVGFAVAGERLAEALRKCKSPYNVNALSQRVAAIILRDAEYLAGCREKLIAGAQTLSHGISAIMQRHPGSIRMQNTCTNFVYLCSEKSDTIYQAFRDSGIAIRNFGNGHLRISTGSPENNEEMLRILEEAVR